MPASKWPATVERCTFGAMRARGDEIGSCWNIEGGAQSFLFKGTNGRWRDVLASGRARSLRPPHRGAVADGRGHLARERSRSTVRQGVSPDREGVVASANFCRPPWTPSRSLSSAFVGADQLASRKDVTAHAFDDGIAGHFFDFTERLVKREHLKVVVVDAMARRRSWPRVASPA